MNQDNNYTAEAFGFNLDSIITDGHSPTTGDEMVSAVFREWLINTIQLSKFFPEAELAEWATNHLANLKANHPEYFDGLSN